MDNKILKNALFGYSKLSVCQYITAINEEFNAKLLEETEAFRLERAKLVERTEALEAELADCKKSQCDAGALLVETRQYAEQLRSQAEEDVSLYRSEAEEEIDRFRSEAEEEISRFRSEAEEEIDRLRSEAEEKLRVQNEKIEAYTKAISALRKNLSLLAGQTDEALNSLSGDFDSLRRDFEDDEQ